MRVRGGWTDSLAAFSPSSASSACAHSHTRCLVYTQKVGGHLQPAHFMSLCHILVILTVFQIFTLFFMVLFRIRYREVWASLVAQLVKKSACHAGDLGLYAYTCPKDSTGRMSPRHRACRGTGKGGSSKALARETAGSQQVEHRGLQGYNIHCPRGSSGRERRLGQSSRAGALTQKTAQPPPRPLEHLKIRSECPHPGPLRPLVPCVSKQRKQRPGGQSRPDHLQGSCSHRLRAERASLRPSKLPGPACWRPQAAPSPGLSGQTTAVCTAFSGGSASAGRGTPVAALVHPWEGGCRAPAG